MIRLTTIGVLASWLLISFSSQQAMAGCAEEIAQVEKERKAANTMSSKAEDAYARIIAGAKQALKEGKKKRCEKMVKSARQKLF